MFWSFRGFCCWKSCLPLPIFTSWPTNHATMFGGEKEGSEIWRRKVSPLFQALSQLSEMCNNIILRLWIWRSAMNPFPANCLAKKALEHLLDFIRLFTFIKVRAASPSQLIKPSKNREEISLLETKVNECQAEWQQLTETVPNLKIPTK